MQEQRVIDVKGQDCPLPLLAAKRAAHQAEPGQEVVIIATDLLSQFDIKAWAEDAEHVAFVGVSMEGTTVVCTFRRLMTEKDSRRAA